MAALHADLRKQLEKAIVGARDVSEAGARAALKQLAVDQADPFKNMAPERLELRVKLRLGVGNSETFAMRRRPNRSITSPRSAVTNTGTECSLHAS